MLNAAGFDTWWLSNHSPFGITGDPLVGVARKDGPARFERRIFPGDHAEIRNAALVLALDLLLAEARAEG